MNLYAVIMAGGRGKRFWPKSRRNKPKQLLTIVNQKTMLEETIQRLNPLIKPENIIIITNQKYQEKITSLLSDIPVENVLAEPVGRNTAPCIALATAWIKKHSPNTVSSMIVLPADHIIAPALSLQSLIASATEKARDGSLITIGVLPNHASSAYGYIECGKKVDKLFHKVKSFTEKPNKHEAQKFLRSSSYRWNSGIFIWRTNAIYKEFKKQTPKLAQFIDNLSVAEDFDTYLQENFKTCPNVSIDYAIMEHAKNLLVCDWTYYWNDIGNWSSLRSILPIDKNGNTALGTSISLDTKYSIILNDSEDLIATVGLRNMIVVKSGNAILICNLKDEQRIKELVAKIEQKESLQDFC